MPRQISKNIDFATPQKFNFDIKTEEEWKFYINDILYESFWTKVWLLAIAVGCVPLIPILKPIFFPIFFNSLRCVAKCFIASLAEWQIGVFISISDKLLFNSGSYYVSDRAKEVLGKVAQVVLDKPEIEFMVEGHTDNVPIQNEILLDNWDLSVKRATSVVRVLQNDFGVPPERMTAAGRSSYIPVMDNDTSDGRAKNRRTRIVVLPKLDQFYDLIEQGMKAATN